MIDRLALGTVQFGLDYGINNPAGRIFPAEVDVLLSRAYEAGVRFLDTAYAYGESERVLGGYSRRNDFNVVSKLAPSQQADRALAESLERLGCKQLYGYLLHDFSATRSGDLSGYRSMRKAVESGVVLKGGFSVYYPEDLEMALQEGLDFELVQIPYSVLDRRFDAILPVLKEKGVEIHVRSIFLQGLVFLSEDRLNTNLIAAAPALKILRELGARYGISLAELCLRSVLSVPQIDQVIVGVNGLQDLESNINACRAGAISDDGILDELKRVSMTDESVLLPFNWNK